MLNLSQYLYSNDTHTSLAKSHMIARAKITGSAANVLDKPITEMYVP